MRLSSFLYIPIALKPIIESNQNQLEKQFSLRHERLSSLVNMGCAEERNLIKYPHRGELWCGLTVDTHCPSQKVAGFGYAPSTRDIRQTLFRALENSTMRMKSIATSFFISQGGSRGRFLAAGKRSLEKLQEL